MPRSGMVHPSAGDCEILGHSVRHDVAAARQSLGICPQQNVLFGTMTVKEHLVLYASIKDGLGAYCTCICEHRVSLYGYLARQHDC